MTLEDHVSAEHHGSLGTSHIIGGRESSSDRPSAPGRAGFRSPDVRVRDPPRAVSAPRVVVQTPCEEHARYQTSDSVRSRPALAHGGGSKRPVAAENWKTGGPLRAEEKRVKRMPARVRKPHHGPYQRTVLSADSPGSSVGSGSENPRLTGRGSPGCEFLGGCHGTRSKCPRWSRSATRGAPNIRQGAWLTFVTYAVSDVLRYLTPGCLSSLSSRMPCEPTSVRS